MFLKTDKTWVNTDHITRVEEQRDVGEPLRLRICMVDRVQPLDVTGDEVKPFLDFVGSKAEKAAKNNLKADPKIDAPPTKS